MGDGNIPAQSQRPRKNLALLWSADDVVLSGRHDRRRRRRKPQSTAAHCEATPSGRSRRIEEIRRISPRTRDLSGQDASTRRKERRQTQVNQQAYYEDLKQLARQVRAEFGLNSPRVVESDLRRIYEKNGIVIDDWPYRLRNLRGAFIWDHLGATVMLASGLPRDPKVFTMRSEERRVGKECRSRWLS